MYKVQRAILLAAGRGSRMRELTEETPKPMLKVNGVRMIDTIIRNLISNGIEEIYIVVGYKKERFQEVAADFPQVKLIENPYIGRANNISSVYVVRDLLENSMILEADQYFLDPSPLTPDFKHTEYNACWKDNADEWTADIDGDDRIIKIDEVHKGPGWLIYGVARWTPEDARKLRELVEYEFDVRHNWDICWDKIALFLHPEDFPEIYIRRTRDNLRVELDSVEELARMDPSYLPYVKTKA